jgi:hypothetical protein
MEFLKLSSLLATLIGITAAVVTIYSLKSMVTLRASRRFSPTVIGLMTVTVGAMIVTLVLPFYERSRGSSPPVRSSPLPPSDLSITNDRQPPQVIVSGAPTGTAGGPDKSDSIEGQAFGCNNCNIVIYARPIADSDWYVQPSPASPITRVRADGKWMSVVNIAPEYAALLVKPTYKPPSRIPVLPEASAEVVAITITRTQGGR